MIKKFKKLLACMVAFFCFFMVAGCAPKDPPPPAEKTEAEMYTVLRGHALNSKVGVDTTQTIASTREGYTEMSPEIDMSNSGLEAPMAETIKGVLEENFDGGKSGSRQEYVHKTDGTGYYKNSEYNSETQAYDIVQQLDKTLKSGNIYTNYLFKAEQPGWQEEVKTASLVDDKYAENTYVLGADEIFGENSDIAGLIDSVKEFESFTDFTENLNDIATSLLGQASEMFGSIPEDKFTINLQLDETDAGYVLVAVVTIEQLTVDMSEMGMPGTAVMDAVATLSINFTDNGVVSSSMGIDSNTVVEMKSKDITQGLVTDETKTIVVNMGTDMLTEYNYNATITDIDTTLSAAVDSYTGTGTNGAVENRNTLTQFNFVGANGSSRYSFKFGEVIDLQDINIDQNLEVLGMYWDKECTQAVAANATYPSYDSEIFIKVKPAEGCAIVNVIIYYEGSDYPSDRFLTFDVSLTSEVLASNLIYGGQVLKSITIDGVEKNLTQGDFTLTLEENKTYEAVIIVEED